MDSLSTLPPKHGFSTRPVRHCTSSTARRLGEIALLPAWLANEPSTTGLCERLALMLACSGRRLLLGGRLKRLREVVAAGVSGGQGDGQLSVAIE